MCLGRHPRSYPAMPTPTHRHQGRSVSKPSVQMDCSVPSWISDKTAEMKSHKVWPAPVSLSKDRTLLYVLLCLYSPRKEYEGHTTGSHDPASATLE
jgi:hypothetical protein